MDLAAVTQTNLYAKSRSFIFNSQRLMGVGGVEDICDYAAI